MEVRRRNSLERYTPKQIVTNDNNRDERLTDQINSIDISDKQNEQKQQRRRVVNNHLYSGQQNRNSDPSHRGNRGVRGRGQGRGRGRGGNYNNENDNNRNTWGVAGNNSNHNEKNKFQYVEDQKSFNNTPFKKQYNYNSHYSKNNTPRKKNTENFKPSHKPADMRILTAHKDWKTYKREMTSRDVLVIHDVFCAPDDLTIYNKLLHEIKNSGVEELDLWQLWHGDSHVIADDKKRWKDACPTFHMVLDKIRDYFQMDIKATRLNWYRDSNEWKPFHHDAAAIKPDKAKTQNFTVGVSFGAERDAAFEHATTKTVISMPQPNGTIYTFGKDVNCIWRHGILQVAPENYHTNGRISIIAWGWAPQTQI